MGGLEEVEELRQHLEHRGRRVALVAFVCGALLAGALEIAIGFSRNVVGLELQRCEEANAVLRRELRTERSQ